MDKNSNMYIIGYAAAMTVVVAVVLSAISEVLKGPQEYNQLMAKKTDILGSVGKAEVDDVEAYYSDHIQELVLDHEGNVLEGEKALDVNLAAQSDIKDPAQRKYPLFIHSGPDGESNYIVPLRGFGLWGPIWGYVAVQEDMNTVAGISFDHDSETPGLGAEITKDWFQESFVGTKLFRNDQFVSVQVTKGSIKNPEHQVSGISGATITGDGVAEMLEEDVSSYLPYFNKIKNS